MSKAPVNKTATVPATTKRGLARQQKFIEVAEHFFLENGYESTSVNEIVKIAGGSLGTLYRLFGNKLGLFEAVFKKKSKELFSQFDRADFWTDDLHNSLFQFGNSLQKLALSRDGIAIYRLVVTENNLDQGEIQKIFYKYGPQTAICMLSTYLQKQLDNGKIELIDPQLAASQFLEMIKGPFTLRALFGEEIQQKELDMALEQAIHIFLQGCRVKQ
ncbi:TetR/AcrR family transcriptional regulator [Thiomicrorhabdus sp. zzn3]|uniref:TetR/AcrR family transcriptional regulator n=1 Tax=Thiomicrorhabdus sp. zzn3 TaxID=3039775 RepID=UPI0024366921|nr:TetR/AcrR family transcriptional regulator [Thiomicrorhabdus sp. zzn3]MDG6778408.1 TetR/AcrR family transcriptional regulator [Thiomicrorhabdus sp. zzn3]